MLCFAVLRCTAYFPVASVLFGRKSPINAARKWKFITVAFAPKKTSTLPAQSSRTSQSSLPRSAGLPTILQSRVRRFRPFPSPLALPVLVQGCAAEPRTQKVLESLTSSSPSHDQPPTDARHCSARLLSSNLSTVCLRRHILRLFTHSKPEHLCIETESRTRSSLFLVTSLEPVEGSVNFRASREY